MKKFTFVLFLTFMSVMTIHAKVYLCSYKTDYNHQSDPSPAYGDESFFSLIRNDSLSQLQPGHIYTVSIIFGDGSSIVFDAPYTCNLDNPEEMELFGIDRGTIEDPNGSAGLYNIAEDVEYDDMDLDGATGDWTPEDFHHFETTTGFYVRIYGSEFHDGEINISIYE